MIKQVPVPKAMKTTAEGLMDRSGKSMMNPHCTNALEEAIKLREKTGGTITIPATYYKNEPWEEYTTLVGNIELNSQRLLELSLDNYVQTGNDKIFEENFIKWQ